MNREKRMYTRVPQKVTARCYDTKLMREFYATLDNISANGMKLTTDTPYTHHHPIKITVVHQNQKSLFQTEGKVAWAKKRDNTYYSLGIQFSTPRLLPLSVFFQKSLTS